MKEATREQIRELVKTTIIRKINKYQSESDYRPFFEAVFDKKTIRLASIVQSLYTSFGMSIYEQMAVILAKEAGFFAERQYELLGEINDETQILISKLCESPIVSEKTKLHELELIRKSSTIGRPLKTSISTVDVFLRSKNDHHEYFIDITTAKLNKKGARTLREKMLKWAALRFSQKPDVEIDTIIGIPYNPYYPDAYNRSFVIGNCHSEEVLVQNEFWSLCAGYDVFFDLIKIFNEVGKELESDIYKFLQ
ncbi:MAG: TdeIII family type II restriction endonuclease [Methanomethylovorans sp.]|nr:TdeIII family type II restriction endonuclease [Methanomethylovorans sp.]